MRHDVSPPAVARRLERLRSICVSESVEEGRRRLEVDARPRAPFAEAVATRLRELRALCELTAYLHRARSR